MSTIKIQKKVLKNGLTVLVYENHTIPRCQRSFGIVSDQKKKSQEKKGIAHLIEHMTI